MADTELREQLKAIPIGVSWPYGSTGVLTDKTIDNFEQLIHARERALLAAIRADLISQGWTASDITQMLSKYESSAENGDA